jgi:hypothetical protein
MHAAFDPRGSGQEAALLIGNKTPRLAGDCAKASLVLGSFATLAAIRRASSGVSRESSNS